MRGVWRGWRRSRRRRRWWSCVDASQKADVTQQVARLTHIRFPGRADLAMWGRPCDLGLI